MTGGTYQNEITERNVMGVPAVFMNGKEFGQGRMTLTEIVAKVDTGAEKRAAEELNKREAYDVLIVGSGPSGAAAAVYSARKGIRTGLMGERFGGQVLDTVDIEKLYFRTQNGRPETGWRIKSARQRIRC
ncbi:alkyl hydroperoxide reductase protein F [Klebsiella michiganensis]|uniref:Alkyl hydroperoxide reductase subunit F n=1 Tax=Klebsiella michiganensis TaxID=1134687 RepID=A0A7H4N4U1_9ENTR|nr:alkyl hydroperoxide reductase protein F [Klebsiella michiganensis]